MSADKLASALKRELSRNKKKTAILGVMCLVACYFWVPLVWRWVAPSNGTSTPAVTESPADSGVAVVVQAADTASSHGSRRREIPWQELLNMIRQDDRMNSAALPETGRNPFYSFTASAVDPIVEKPAQPQPTALIATSFADLAQGLELTGIVYGPRLRIATINGAEYRENDRLEIGLAPPSVSSPLASGAILNEDRFTPPVGDARDIAALAAEMEAQAASESTDAIVAEEAVALSTSPPIAAPDAGIAAVVASIRPKSVEIRFSDGTTSLLTLAGATINQQDVIRLTRTKPRP